MKPMLAQIGSKKDLERKDFIFEPKFDGTRVLIYKDGKKIRIINRRGKDITYRYPELSAIFANIKAEKCILDGELVVLDKKGRPDFNLLQQREQLEEKIIIEARSKINPATIFVFDLLEVDSQNVMKEPLEKRKERLAKIIENSPFIVLCPYSFDGKALWKKIKKLGLEGVIAKKIGSVYEQCRSNSWLKIKNFNTIDAIVVGFTKGAGKRAKYFGALVLAAYKEKKLCYVGRVGTGFDEKMLLELGEMMKKLITKKAALPKKEQRKIKKEVIWIKPKLIAEIKYLELTKKLELRAPSFVRLRFDKKLQDCVIE